MIRTIFLSLALWIGLMSLAAAALVGWVGWHIVTHIRERRRQRFIAIADPVRPLRRDVR